MDAASAEVSLLLAGDDEDMLERMEDDGGGGYSEEEFSGIDQEGDEEEGGEEEEEGGGESIVSDDPYMNGDGVEGDNSLDDVSLFEEAADDDILQEGEEDGDVRKPVSIVAENDAAVADTDAPIAKEVNEEAYEEKQQHDKEEQWFEKTNVATPTPSWMAETAAGSAHSDDNKEHDRRTVARSDVSVPPPAANPASQSAAQAASANARKASNSGQSQEERQGADQEEDAAATLRARLLAAKPQTYIAPPPPTGGEEEHRQVFDASPPDVLSADSAVVPADDRGQLVSLGEGENEEANNRGEEEEERAEERFEEEEEQAEERFEEEGEQEGEKFEEEAEEDPENQEEEEVEEEEEEEEEEEGEGEGEAELRESEWQVATKRGEPMQQDVTLTDGTPARLQLLHRDSLRGGMEYLVVLAAHDSEPQTLIHTDNVNRAVAAFKSAAAPAAPSSNTKHVPPGADDVAGGQEKRKAVKRVADADEFSTDTSISDAASSQPTAPQAKRARAADGFGDGIVAAPTGVDSLAHSKALQRGHARIDFPSEVPASQQATLLPRDGSPHEAHTAPLTARIQEHLAPTFEQTDNRLNGPATVVARDPLVDLEKTVISSAREKYDSVRALHEREGTKLIQDIARMYGLQVTVIGTDIQDH